LEIIGEVGDPEKREVDFFVDWARVRVSVPLSFVLRGRGRRLAFLPSFFLLAWAVPPRWANWRFLEGGGLRTIMGGRGIHPALEISSQDGEFLLIHFASVRESKFWRLEKTIFFFLVFFFKGGVRRFLHC